MRAPEKRATLAEISAHPWLAVDKEENQTDVHPLVSKEQLTEEDHNLIVQKIVNGNIATKEEIQEYVPFCFVVSPQIFNSCVFLLYRCLDKNEYNHITATYFLLAERKLRSKRQDTVIKTKRPEHLAVPHVSPAPIRDVGSTNQNPCLLAVPRTPGDVPQVGFSRRCSPFSMFCVIFQRSRKCSIVQEDEEEEDISGCSGREELTPPHCSLNRRGSRSEGRLNLALQERLVESERRKSINEKGDVIANNVTVKVPEIKKIGNIRPKSADEKAKPQQIPPEVKILGSETIPVTTIITDSSTVCIPVITNSSENCQVLPKYKTMPSPLHLNEIFEEGDNTNANPRSTARQFVSRNQNRTSYEQRRSKFHKNRTASCSSSDASDDDSENRKKRAHKLGGAAKPLPPRRDSHDDSSDSQEPGTGTGTAGGGGGHLHSAGIARSNGDTVRDSHQGKGGGGNTGGRKNADVPNVVFGKRHKVSRRRNGETRLRESQSLNRITEVQEDGAAHALVIATTVTGLQVRIVRTFDKNTFFLLIINQINRINSLFVTISSISTIKN